MTPIIIPLVDAIIWLGEHILGPMEGAAKYGISAALKGAGGLLSTSFIITIFEKFLGTIEDTKKQELNNALSSMLGQVQENIAEDQAVKKWYEMPHSTLEMLGVLYIGVHLFLLTTIDIENFVLVHFSDTVLSLPTIDLTMFGMVMTLMGVYKIVGKFNVPDDNE